MEVMNLRVVWKSASREPVGVLFVMMTGMMQMLKWSAASLTTVLLVPRLLVWLLLDRELGLLSLEMLPVVVAKRGSPPAPCHFKERVNADTLRMLVCDANLSFNVSLCNDELRSVK